MNWSIWFRVKSIGNGFNFLLDFNNDYVLISIYPIEKTLSICRLI